MKKKVNLFEAFLGIDISKLTLDYCLLDSSGNLIKQSQVKNTPQGIKDILKELKHLKIAFNNLIICYENTGVYTMVLNTELTKMKLNFWVVPAIEIKRSKGLARGKSDKKDAKNIALYALKNAFNFKQYVMPDKDILKLKVLQTQREKVIDCIKNLEMFNENKKFFEKDVLKETDKINQKCVKELRGALENIELQMDEILKSNLSINRQLKLITSIPGIGKQTAIYLLIVTNGFSNFKESRQLACYAGIAPFEYSSGTSLQGRRKVSHFADKKLKSLLHMCAISSIRFNKEIKIYYDRKKIEGKHSLLALNNVKNKLLGRVFAVINRDQPYIDNYKWAA